MDKSVGLGHEPLSRRPISLTTLTSLVLAVGTSLSPALAAVRRVALEPQVSPQGLIQTPADGSGFSSPLRSCTLEATPLSGDFVSFEWALRIQQADGAVFRIPRVSGNGFLISDVGRVVILESYHSAAVQSRLSVLDFHGQELLFRQVPRLSAAALSRDGTRLAYRTETDIVLLDLLSLEEIQKPACDLFVVGPEGRYVGVTDSGRSQVLLSDAQGRETRFALNAKLRKVDFTRDGSALLMLTDSALAALPLAGGQPRIIYQAAPGAELRDLLVLEDRLLLGARSVQGVQGAQFSGQLVQLDLPGVGASVTGSVTATVSGPALPPVKIGSVPWPLAPNQQHSVGNTYGEFQNYGGTSYLHPGIDVLGADNQPVYAVRAGVVKAWLTTSADYHWRLAIGDSGGSGTTAGYLDAHIDRFSVAVNEGDTVSRGQYLGNLVAWPVAGFTHTHFARIQASGVRWNGSWFCPDNPHTHLQNQSDSTSPFFLNARGSDLLAFCRNQSSTYRNPNALTGQVDIVARVGDTIQSGWVCAVQELRYSIYPAGNPGAMVVADRLAVRFDMGLDTYQSGSIDAFLVGLLYKRDGTCFTEGDYSNREFYHILTNNDGDEVYESSDLQEAWDTNLLSDGDYVVEVTATDASGNSTTAQMTVTTNNGNP